MADDESKDLLLTCHPERGIAAAESNGDLLFTSHELRVTSHESRVTAFNAPTNFSNSR